jgi:hypothetical protein
MRITVATPEALRDDSNALAMVLAFGPDDGNTYGSLNWQDADGNLYAAASFEARPEWVTVAQAPLERPEWDVELESSDPSEEPYVINMESATRAQAALVFWVPSEETPDAPQASTTALTAIAGVDGLEALSLMGLTIIPQPDETV